MSFVPTEPAIAASDHRRIIPGVAVAGFCVFLQFYAPQPLLVLFRESFGASEARVSLVMSVATLAVAIASPFMGMLADAVGRKRVIVPCLLALAFFTFATALSQSLEQIIFWRLLGGICTPGVVAVTLAYISEESPRMSAGGVTALYVAGTVLGGLTGRLSAAFAADYLSWRWAFVILALLTLLGAICVWLLLPRSQNFRRQTQWRQSVRAAASHLRNGRLLATYLTGFTVLFCHVGLFTYLNFHLAKAPFHLSTSALGAIFIVYALGIIVTPLSGNLVDRAGHRTGVFIAAALVVGGSLLTLIPSLVLIICGIALASSGVFVGHAAASSHAGRAAKESRSVASGLYVSAYYLGGSIGATALVVPWQLGQWPGVIATIICVQVVSLALTWRFFTPAAAGQHAQPIPIE